MTLLGLCGGYIFAKHANEDKTTIWAAFIVLTALHLLANFRGVRALRIPTVNFERGRHLIAAFESFCERGGEYGSGAVRWHNGSPHI